MVYKKIYLYSLYDFLLITPIGLKWIATYTKSLPMFYQSFDIIIFFNVMCFSYPLIETVFNLKKSSFYNLYLLFFCFSFCGAFISIIIYGMNIAFEISNEVKLQVLLIKGSIFLAPIFYLFSLRIKLFLSKTL